jgi:hypothetical protein
VVAPAAAASETVRDARAGRRREASLERVSLLRRDVRTVASAVTHSIRRGAGSLRDVEIGRRHIHHFVPGHPPWRSSPVDSPSCCVASKLEHWLAVSFRAGAALIVDETALLIEQFDDVYWSDKACSASTWGWGATSAPASLALLVRLSAAAKRWYCLT